VRGAGSCEASGIGGDGGEWLIAAWVAEAGLDAPGPLFGPSDALSRQPEESDGRSRLGLSWPFLVGLATGPDRVQEPVPAGRGVGRWHRKPGPPSWLLIRRSLGPEPKPKSYIPNADAGG
jgi:hypothetical protein